MCGISTLDEEPARILAQRLFHYLNGCSDSNYDYSDVDALRTTAWLPTSRGLRRSDECRDDSESHRRALFDHVLAVLEITSVDLINPKLRKALGWHQPLPLAVLKQQLEAEISNESRASRLELLIRELGSRVDEIQRDKLKEFREVVHSAPWIPVSVNILSTTSHTILDQNFSLQGFHNVPSKFAFNEGIRCFLQLMGCSDRPSNSSLCRLLSDLRGRILNENEQRFAVELINSLDTRRVDDYIADVQILDRYGQLRPISQLFYNDFGPGRQLVELPPDRFQIDARIGEQLATSLGVIKLSSLSLPDLDDDEDDDEDMQEPLTTRLGNVLRQYSISQAFNEFLANAADAGARQYSLLIDSHSAPSEYLVSPSMAQFQSGPSLVLYNDAVFKEQDFKGIRFVGLGGKQERADAIGKFGLGALSMFHFAEIVMIISGSYVQFLDPSASYLPPRRTGRRRTACKIPLSNLHQTCHDHLKALHGVFAFREDMDYYPGTLFWLPLRNSTNASTSAITQELIDLSKLQGLVRDYFDPAKESLLFIPVNSIAAFERRRSGVQETWRVQMQSSSAEDIGGNISRREVTVTHQQSSSKVYQRQWLIAHLREEPSELPSDFQHLIVKHRMREVSVAVAALLDDVGPVQRSQFRLYSKLPLPTLTILPLHLDASWILAEDRRNIRFDDSGQVNSESRYNRWLLSEKAPSVYTALLESWPKTNNTHMWPGHSNLHEDPISRALIHSFYGDKFTKFSRAFCPTASSDNRALSPSQAVFGSDEDSVAKLLRILQTPELVIVPARIYKRLKRSAVPLIDAKFVREVVIRDGALASAYHRETVSIRDVDTILRYIYTNSKDLLLGMPVVLADRTLGTLQASSAPTIFFTPPSLVETPWPLFSAERFTHLDLPIARRLVGCDTNIAEFTGEGVSAFMKDTVRLPTHSPAQLSKQQEKWVKDFWRRRKCVPMDDNGIMSIGFPLIPSLQERTYISLPHCSDPAVFATQDTDDDQPWIDHFISALGGVLIDRNHSSHPPALQDILRRVVSPIGTAYSSTLTHILQFLAQRGATKIPHLFSTSVTPDILRAFASFARRHIGTLRTGSGYLRSSPKMLHEDVIIRLPIWESRQGTSGTVSYRSADDYLLHMLPHQLDFDRVKVLLSDRYYYVNHDGDLTFVLSVMNKTQVSPADIIRTHLTLPSRIEAQADLASYRYLLEYLLRNTGDSQVWSSLRLPNEPGYVVSRSSLYARSVALFVETLRRHPEHFLHPSLSPLEHRLSSNEGIKCAIDFESFKHCASVVHTDRGAPGHADRAAALFDYYNNNLWLHVGSNASKWHELDDKQFIPRSRFRRSSGAGTQFSDYANELPDVATPRQIMRPEFEAVAWTQRALPVSGFSERLLLANLGLGVPSAEEVVKHLVTLVIIAADHSGDAILLSDLRKTYKWLSDNSSSCQTLLYERRHDRLFLNMDGSPEYNRQWNFAAASELWFNAPDEGSRQRVRSFLKPYRKLLLKVGAKEIKNAVAPPLDLSPDEETLSSMRSSFVSMREQEQLTDVILESSDGQKYPAHRLVLAVATRYFKDMFKRDWSESQGGSPLQIPYSGVILKVVLDQIYTGSAEPVNDQDDLLELLELADRWELPGLFARVERWLIPTITIGTYRDVQEIGEKYHAKVLCKACENFCADNADALSDE
ncbi:hypothetical protein K474DRAFT_1776994 [Panus rudis PR-1116 ss-1]|nr:hypothetical protein K474DRAFT_1776994 [Panus rudis PR-1116 ss-1]